MVMIVYNAYRTDIVVPGLEWNTRDADDGEDKEGSGGGGSFTAGLRNSLVNAISLRS